MCKPKESSFIIDVWCSYILRGILIASLSGGVVGTFGSITVSRLGLWVQFCVGAIFFFVLYTYYLFLAKMLPVTLVVSCKN